MIHVLVVKSSPSHAVGTVVYVTGSDGSFKKVNTVAFAAVQPNNDLPCVRSSLGSPGITRLGHSSCWLHLFLVHVVALQAVPCPSTVKAE